VSVVIGVGAVMPEMRKSGIAFVDEPAGEAGAEGDLCLETESPGAPVEEQAFQPRWTGANDESPRLT
jgi:hypothetical protein